MTANTGIRLTLNGRETLVSARDLAALAAEAGLNSRALVAEVNGVIVTAGDFERTPLAEGDTVELVRFVGGG